MTKLPRTLRLDPSDAFVFAQAAEPGEWAVTGTFLFLEADPAALSPKERAAFRSGFVGVETFGFSTLVVVSEASAADRAGAVAALARQIHDRLGAPDLATAEAAAEEEIAAAEALCQPEVGAVIALHRSLEDGAFRERFRTLRKRAPGEGDRLHGAARAFTFMETDEEEPEEAPEDSVDLLGLMGRT